MNQTPQTQSALAAAEKAPLPQANSPTDWREGRRDFRLLWFGQSVSILADQVMVLVLPLFAILVLHASPAQAALVPFALYLSFPLLGLPAGALVDRLRRRPVMVVCDVIQAASFATIAILAWKDSLSFTMLLVLVGVSGCATVFFQIAYTSYLPSLFTEPASLHRGNSRLTLSESLGRAAGPLLAGPLLAVAGPVVAIAANAGSFAISVLTLLRLRGEPPVAKPEQNEPRRLRREIREGLAFVFSHPLLEPVILCGTVYVLFLSLINATLVLFCHEVLGLEPLMIGLVIGTAAIGYPIGNMVSSAVMGRLGIPRTLVLAAAVSVAGIVTIPVFGAMGSVPGLIAGSILHGVGEGSFTPTSLTLRQTVTPAHLLGRVNSVQRVLLAGAVPAGSLVASVTVAALGLSGALWIGGLGTVLCLVPLLRRGILSSLQGKPASTGSARE
jgi:MFS family permease